MKIKEKYSEFEHFYKLTLFDESENVVAPLYSGTHRYKSYGSAVLEAMEILENVHLVSYVEGFRYENDSDEGAGGIFVFKAELLENGERLISSRDEFSNDDQNANDSESSTEASAQASKQPFREYI